jgi:hypothetical protein
VTPDYETYGPIWAVEPRALIGPTVSFFGSAINIDPGGSATLTWSSNGESCTASGAWSGAKNTSGTETVSPASSSVYTLRCLDVDGNGSTRSVTILVGGIPVGGGDGNGDGDPDDALGDDDDGGGSLGWPALLVLLLFSAKLQWRRQRIIDRT